MTGRPEDALVRRWDERLREGPTRRIAFTDGTDQRVLSAAARLAHEGLVEPVLVGDGDRIESTAHSVGVGVDHVEVVEVADVAGDAGMERALTIALHGRRHDPIPELLRDPLHAGALLLSQGRVDGCVSGASITSGEVIRSGIRIVGLARDVAMVSSSFLLVMSDGRSVAFGDCAVVPEPNAEELADIAVSTAATFRLLTEEEPVVALLSHSTKGSADTAGARRVRLAAEQARRLAPDLVIDGELQFDAAVSARVSAIKAPESSVAGTANVFVFPNLDAGNIAYKLTQYFARAAAFGPLFQGMAAPLNDLSRGCSADDVVAVAKITALQAAGTRFRARQQSGETAHVVD